MTSRCPEMRSLGIYDAFYLELHDGSRAEHPPHPIGHCEPDEQLAYAAGFKLGRELKRAGSLGQKIRRIRAFYRLSQAELAELIKCTPKTIVNLEADRTRPSNAVLRNLAPALGIMLEVILLILGEDPVPPRHGAALTKAA